VSLVLALYKELCLEGGQTKEEEKRKEIFFNEIWHRMRLTGFLTQRF
jgi:hypothetical protein